MSKQIEIGKTVFQNSITATWVQNRANWSEFDQFQELSLGLKTFETSKANFNEFSNK